MMIISTLHRTAQLYCCCLCYVVVYVIIVVTQAFRVALVNAVESSAVMAAADSEFNQFGNEVCSLCVCVCVCVCVVFIVVLWREYSCTS